MSAEHLPEDLQRWPRDPFQVLGVPRGCDPGEARKAYTRLIRHFKPEQHPDHFRTIREAYDAVKRELQYLRGFPGDFSIDDRGPPEPGLGANTDSLQILWDMACNGREEESYA